MYDLSKYEDFLEENIQGVGDRIKNDTPKEIYEEIKEIDREYFNNFKTHLFQEFRVDGDGDIVYEAKMKAKANKLDKEQENDRSVD